MKRTPLNRNMSPLRRARTLPLALLCLASCALALGQNSPAPDGPAEGSLRANPGTNAPGVHPPSPMDGHRFSPGPPPPMPGTVETPPAGKVKTEEKLATPGPTVPTANVSRPATTPVPSTPTAASTTTKTTPGQTPAAFKGKKTASRSPGSPGSGGAVANPKPTPAPAAN